MSRNISHEVVSLLGLVNHAVYVRLPVKALVIDHAEIFDLWLNVYRDAVNLQHDPPRKVWAISRPREEDRHALLL